MATEKSDRISDAIVKSILTITIVITCYLIIGPYSLPALFLGWIIFMFARGSIN
ncbi:MAG: hypothetical protein AB9882_10420 [Ignavibacteriaceae bacterium]